jgi:hypothetical protein
MPTSFGTAVLYEGREMPWDHYLESPNGLFHAELHGDGQLVVKRFNAVTNTIEVAWDSATPLGPNCRLVILELVVRGPWIVDPNGGQRFCRDLATLGATTDSRLVMQDDGNLVYYPFPDRPNGAKGTSTQVSNLRDFVVPGSHRATISGGVFGSPGNHVISNGTSGKLAVSDGQTGIVLKPNELVSVQSGGSLDYETKIYTPNYPAGVLQMRSSSNATGVRDRLIVIS